MANVEKKDGSSKKVYLIIILVIVGAALFALGVFLGTYISGKDLLLQGSIELGNNSPFTFVDVDMETVLTPQQEQMEGEEAVAYFGFSLDSKYGDNEGRLRWDGKHSEKMTVRVKGSITHAELLKEIKYRVNMPVGVIEAAKVGYLDITEFYETDENGEYVVDMPYGNFVQKVKTIEVKEDELVAAENEEDGMVFSFEFDLVMNWGSYFEGKNPSEYFDETEAGLAVDEEGIERVLTDMRNIILNNEEEARFTVYLDATPKETMQI